ncbi:MAG: FAD-binding protein [Acidobacteria bacterium]|nr:FAD-binding protein [Acidobacteriota bacterium]
MTPPPRASQGSPPPSYSRDFGGLVHAAPARIAHPSSAREVSLAFRSARADGLAVAVRGAGHSQSGHTVVREGLVIDTSRLCGVTVHDGDILEVGGGQPWGGVIDALHGTGLTVPVLTDSAFPTVGGTLSAGGFGAASVRFGAQVGHVERLEVVTPAGDLVTCSREAERELFDAVRAGQGQFGVIARAWLRLRRCPSRIRYYALRYVDTDRLADDAERLYSDARYGHLRLQLRPDSGDAVLRVGVEYEPPAPSPLALLFGLGCVEAHFDGDGDDIGRAGLLPDDLFPRQRFHPWRDWFLPWGALRPILDRAPVPLDWLPPAPHGWAGCYFVCGASIDAPAFVRPPGDRFLSYSVLSVFERRADALEARDRLDAADRVIRDLGGCAYLSGATGYDASRWRAHFGGARHARLVRLQRAVDPAGLLRRPGLPFCA